MFQLVPLAESILGADAAKYAKEITSVGSRVTCSPAPTDTDRDFLVLVEGRDWGNLWGALERDKWKVDGSLPVNAEPWDASVRFSSFKRDECNLICTDAPDFHRRFLAATAIAKRFNLLEKADRIALFQAVLYGNGVAA